MENPANFRLLFLPRVALDEVISMMVPFELMNFSKISPRTEIIVKTLPVRKRTYEVFLKISHFSNFTIYGSNMKWELVFPDEKTDEDRFEDFYLEFEFQRMKESYEYINRILNCSIKFLWYVLLSSTSDHKSMIDWLKSQQESVKEFFIYSGTGYDNDLEYLLRNVKATERLTLKAKNRLHFEWDELLPKNLDLLDVDASNGINLQQLLTMNNSVIHLENSKLTSREINSFLKSWMASESNLNLECFQVNIENDEAMDTILDLPHQEVSYENGKVFGNNKTGTTILYEGIEIKQSSGKTGVMAIGEDNEGMFLMLFIF